MNKWLLSGISAGLTCACLLPLRADAAGAVALSAVPGAVSAQQPLGRFELFASVPGTSGGIYHTWQLNSQVGWQQSWQRYLPAPDSNAHGLVAGRDGAGRIVAAWISSGSIYFAEAVHADASLTAGDSLKISDVIDPFDGKAYKFKYLAIGRYPTGRIEVLALSDNGRVWSIRQTNLTDDGNPWIGLAKSNGQVNRIVALVGGGDLQTISVTNLNKGLALIGTGKNGKVYVKKQSSPETWDSDPWIDLEGNNIQDARAAESRDHQLEVVAFGADKRFYLQFQNVGAASWSGWQGLLNGTETFGPSFFFSQFRDGSLFLTTHFDFDNSSQFKGTFAKAFQGPNNGGWSGDYFRYEASTIHPTGVTNSDSLEFLSADAFAVATDANGDTNYFVCYRNSPLVEHYIDRFGASPNRHLVYQGAEHTIANLPP